uniref:Uncharacterized protein n=1 Tax=Klebsiella pneumoniae TaxID=573 RepID=A0A2P1BN92_KLEPN|nr:hypothetical protein [Klebsiella pneumoniae]
MTAGGLPAAFPADGAPARRQRLFGTSAAFVLQLLHVVRHRIDRVVGELPVAYPGIAQQVELGLIGLQIAQVVDGVEVCGLA